MSCKRGCFSTELTLRIPLWLHQSFLVTFTDDEEIVTCMLAMWPDCFSRFVVLLSSTPLLERTCVRTLLVATDLSVLDSRSQYLGSLLRQLLSLNKLKKMILSSFQSHPGPNTKLCEVMSTNCSLGSQTFGDAVFGKKDKRACEAGVREL